jgi:hypothetical protein
MKYQIFTLQRDYESMEFYHPSREPYYHMMLIQVPEFGNRIYHKFEDAQADIEREGHKGEIYTILPVFEL